VLVLCRDVYHCTPSGLEDEDWGQVSLHMEMMAMEARVGKVRRR